MPSDRAPSHTRVDQVQPASNWQLHRNHLLSGHPPATTGHPRPVYTYVASNWRWPPSCGEAGQDKGCPSSELSAWLAQIGPMPIWSRRAARSMRANEAEANLIMAGFLRAVPASSGDVAGATPTAAMNLSAASSGGAAPPAGWRGWRRCRPRPPGGWWTGQGRVGGPAGFVSG